MRKVAKASGRGELGFLCTWLMCGGGGVLL